jgi:DNA-binding NtrC family response regulator
MASAAAVRGTTKLQARRIAFVTTDETAFSSIEEHLVPVFHTTLLGESAAVEPLFKATGLDAVIMDLESGGQQTAAGIQALENLRKLNDDMVLIALSRSQGHALRNKTTHAGADDLFIAPVDFHELQVVLQRAIHKKEMETESRRVREDVATKNSFGDMVGGCDPMRVVYEAVMRVADSTTTVVIRGESGCGKELVARAIVNLSPRREKPFVSVNCAALPENLIEAELFGHEKGSFTGAHVARAGHIEAADGGTLFLDEIATLGLALQSKLLRVLEDHAVMRVGGKSARKIDFRLVTATNEDLEEMVRAGRFREDLYYRIHVVPITLPPLRERTGDLPLLLDHFLRIYCTANRVPLKKVDPEVIEVLEDYEWPGNVRELENLVQRLVLMAEGGVIRMKHLPQQIIIHSTAQQQKMLIPEEGIHFEDEMVRIERAYIEAALQRSQGKKFAAARLLHIPPQRMKYLCRKYGL